MIKIQKIVFSGLTILLLTSILSPLVVFATEAPPGVYVYYDLIDINRPGGPMNDGEDYTIAGSGRLRNVNYRWEQRGNFWYLYINGQPVSNRWFQDTQGRWYWIHPNRRMATGWVLINGNYHSFNNSGVMRTGWFESGNNWYFLHRTSGTMQMGWLNDGGSRFFLNPWPNVSGHRLGLPVGAMFHSGTFRIGNVYHQFASDGSWLREAVAPWFQRPTARGEMNSPFGYRILEGSLDFHHGVDIRNIGNVREPILASATGTVAFTPYNHRSFGWHIILQHNINGVTYFTLYAHLRYAPARSNGSLLTVGDFVAQDSQIGIKGSTGNSSGPHLHFEIHRINQFCWNARIRREASLLNPENIISISRPWTTVRGVYVPSTNNVIERVVYFNHPIVGTWQLIEYSLSDENNENKEDLIYLWIQNGTLTSDMVSIPVTFNSDGTVSYAGRNSFEIWDIRDGWFWTNINEGGYYVFVENYLILTRTLPNGSIVRQVFTRLADGD